MRSQVIEFGLTCRRNTGPHSKYGHKCKPRSANLSGILKYRVPAMYPALPEAMILVNLRVHRINNI
jgi:hypothetical protein